ncbi:MAG: hypothetical protein ACFFCQ_10685 [Promethearchaeota archaeon]
MIDELKTAGLSEIFSRLEPIIEKIMEKGGQEAGSLLAELFYNLFQSATFEKNENARIFLKFLQKDLGRIIETKDKTIGVMTHSFSLRWFRLISKLEELIIDYKTQFIPDEKVVKLSKNHDDFAPQLYEILPCLHEPVEISKSNSELIAKIKKILEKDHPGKSLQEFYLTLQKKSIFRDDEDSKKWLTELQSHLDTVIKPNDPNFNSIFFEFATCWFRYNVTLRKEVRDLIQEYEQKSELKTTGRERPKAFAQETSFADVVSRRKMDNSS